MTKEGRMYKDIYDKMAVSYELAVSAGEKGEIPVGCAIFMGDELISSAHNLSEETQDPTEHAEMKVIKDAVKKIGRKAMRECELFVTLEPCPMCAGAIIHAGIKSVYFGSYDKNFGAYDGYVNLFSHPYAKGINVYGGIMEEKCTVLLRDFFEKIRKNEHK